MKLIEKILVATDFVHASKDALQTAFVFCKKVPLGDHPDSSDPRNQKRKEADSMAWKPIENRKNILQGWSLEEKRNWKKKNTKSLQWEKSRGSRSFIT